MEHELVEFLMPLRRPVNEEMEAALDGIRESFTDLGHEIVAVTQVSPEQTIAIRKLHKALMATTFAIVTSPSLYESGFTPPYDDDLNPVRKDS